MLLVPVFPFLHTIFVPKTILITLTGSIAESISFEFLPIDPCKY